MDLLDFARGPAIHIALAIFALGVLWRLLGVLLLPWRLIQSQARPGSPSPFSAAIKGILVKLWPHKEFMAGGFFTFLNGYVFHVGLAIAVLLFVPHILFIKDLIGISWPGLPSNAVFAVGVITAVSLLAALANRLFSPVLRLISRADDYISWLMTFLPVITGLLAVSHLGARYEVLIAIHILSVAAFLIWFPFGKLMHAFLFVFSRGMTGVRFGHRGAEL
jgi:nitrate reductase gamma subunit